MVCVGSRRLSRWVALGAVCALVATAATGVAAAGDGRSRPTRLWKPLSCNPVHATGCVLPFPSDVFARADVSSPTGRRLQVADDIWPAAMREQLPPEVAPSAIFDGHDGFSALGPILFEVDAPYDAATLPADGGDALAVFDTTTGARVPIHAGLDTQARAHDPGSTVIRAWPVDRFDWGHHYVAVLTSALRHPDGTVPPRPATLQAVMDATAAPRWVEYHRGLFDAVARHGVQRDDVIAITGFTVRSEADATAPLLALVDRARAEEHQVKEIRAFPLGGEIAALVTGMVRLTDFRDPVTGGMRWDPDGGRDEWVPFMLTIPRSAATQPAPVAVYSHGITVMKETALLFAEPNARHGIATIAIDHPQHGWRAMREGGWVFQLGRPSEIARQIALPIQSAIDFVSLVKAVQTSLADLDVAPVSLRTLWGDPGDGRPDLDPGRMIAEGTSMGGVLGLEFMAVEPQVGAGMFQVPGMGILHILTGSVIWKPLGLDGLIPVGATGADVSAAIAASQYMIDPGDATNYAAAVQARDRPLVVVYGEGDAIVPNYGTQRLIDLTGLQALANPSDYAGGSGIFREPMKPGPPAVIGPLMHVSFSDPAPWSLVDAWLTNLPQGSK